MSILRNGPERFEGRKLGVLVTDGVNAELVRDVRSAFEGAGAMVEIVAPEVGGVKASDDSWIEGDEKLDGAPSVVYDAVAVLSSAKGGEALAKIPQPKTSSPTRLPTANSSHGRQGRSLFSRRQASWKTWMRACLRSRAARTLQPF